MKNLYLPRLITILIISFIILAIVLTSCSQRDYSITEPTYDYTLHFKIYQDQKSQYLIQRLDSVRWTTIKSIGDTSLSGEYFVDLHLNLHDLIRVQAQQVGDTVNSEIVQAGRE